MEILAVRDLTFAYAGQEKNTLKDLSFSLEKGEFVTLMGTTGSGKSTLLRLLKPELTPQGQQTGMIRLGEQNLFSLSPRESACRIGFVMQRPEQQIVTDKVWHELAFGLENLGLPTDTIRRQVAEIFSFQPGEPHGAATCQLSPSRVTVSPGWTHRSSRRLEYRVV